MNKKDLDRFMTHVKVDLLTNCWEWQGPFNEDDEPIYELPDGTVVDAKVYIMLAMEDRGE